VLTVVLRGKDDTGKDLIISRDYIAEGMRHRASELATEWLGPRSELEMQRSMQREVEQERWTGLDRTLQREAGDDGLVRIERFAEPRLQRQEMTRRNLNIQPTLTERPGLPVRIIVNRDLVLRPYQPLFFNRGASR
jgi:type IV secretory pathway VirD2 relaxase